MAVCRHSALEASLPLITVHIHYIATKCFHYHDSASFPYNLLITVLSKENDCRDHFINEVTGERTDLQAGHAYLLPCHLPIRFERTPACTVVTMRFNITFFHGRDIYDGSKHIEDIPAPQFAHFLDDSIQKNEEEHIATALRIKNKVTELCLSRWPQHRTALSPAMWRYERVFTHIQEHGNASTTVADLARICSMRQDVFSRSFSRDVGISPQQYLHDILIRTISTNLLTSHLSIKEIAANLRFSSPYYLSRFFKKHTNFSPREYQKRFKVPE